MNPVLICECPFCKEPVGYPCRTTDGAPRVMAHIQRRKLARRAARASEALRKHEAGVSR